MNRTAERIIPIGEPGGEEGVGLGALVCCSRVMRRCLEEIERVSASDLPVLISGESGVGKELAARAIHDVGRRRGHAFVPLNCGALPLELAESELFGHSRGAYTGAHRAHDGAFMTAHQGTLFLDEVGELPPTLQPKLLRALETGEIRPVGTTARRVVDVRLVAATNRDLHSEAAGGRFRVDLLYRLDVLHVHLPPLRHRLDDLDVLVPQLLRRHGYRVRITPDAMERLRRHHWPGNVRELRNVLIRAAHASGDRLTERAIGRALRSRALGSECAEPLRESAYRYATDALAANGGNRRATYEALGVPKSTFYRWLRSGRITDTPQRSG